nr:terminase small subunit [Achromobacter sp. RTa]
MQAAIRAGYSQKTANEQGAQLLAKLSIQDAVKAAQDKRSARTEITQDMVCGSWPRLASATSARSCAGGRLSVVLPTTRTMARLPQQSQHQNGLLLQVAKPYRPPTV